MIVLMLGAGTVLNNINGSGQEDDGWIRAVLFILIWGVYEPVAMVLGCTLGNYLMKIRVRRHEHIDKKINLLQAHLRFIIKITLGWISFLTINSNKERRAIHDFAAGSVMIEK